MSWFGSLLTWNAKSVPESVTDEPQKENSVVTESPKLTLHSLLGKKIFLKNYTVVDFYDMNCYLLYSFLSVFKSEIKEDNFHPMDLVSLTSWHHCETSHLLNTSSKSSSEDESTDVTNKVRIERQGDVFIFTILNPSYWDVTLDIISSSLRDNQEKKSILFVMDSESDTVINYGSQVWIVLSSCVDELVGLPSFLSMCEENTDMTVFLMSNSKPDEFRPDFLVSQSFEETRPNFTVFKNLFQGYVDYETFSDSLDNLDFKSEVFVVSTSGGSEILSLGDFMNDYHKMVMDKSVMSEVMARTYRLVDQPNFFYKSSSSEDSDSDTDSGTEVDEESVQYYTREYSDEEQSSESSEDSN